MAQHTIRAGMMAYMGITEQIQAEQAYAYATALIAAQERETERLVAATRVGNTKAFQRHYMADVQVTYKRRHIVLKGQLSL
jgi:hypothetical protein